MDVRSCSFHAPVVHRHSTCYFTPAIRPQAADLVGVSSCLSLTSVTRVFSPSFSFLAVFFSVTTRSLRSWIPFLPLPLHFCSSFMLRLFGGARAGGPCCRNPADILPLLLGSVFVLTVSCHSSLFLYPSLWFSGASSFWGVLCLAHPFPAIVLPFSF